MLGFLPLQSYLDTKKQVKNAQRCPPEKEDLVRALLFRDALEQLGCTYIDIDSKVDLYKKDEDSMFGAIDNMDETSEPLKKLDKPLIVLDA